MIRSEGVDCGEQRVRGGEAEMDKISLVSSRSYSSLS